ncbi:MAG: hypothetical protein ACREC9_09455 [Methylocella sp.]
MSQILDHLNQVSVFGPSAFAFFLILGLDWAFSVLHSYQEWKGEKVPLWRVFGAIVGVWLPNWLGFASFTLLLTLLLWGTGLAGIAAWLPIVGQVSSTVAVGALGALIGARISDTLVHHWGPYTLAYRPNPGLKSTPLYVIEAIFILVTFWKGLALFPVAAWLGFACGAGLIALVLPTLRTLRVIASWRRKPWVRGEPIPAWTMD